MTRVFSIALAWASFSFVTADALAQRAPAEHQTALRDELDRPVRVLRTIDLPIANGKRFIVSVASWNEDGENLFALVHSRVDGRRRFPAVVTELDDGGERFALERFEAMAVPVGDGTQVFVEIEVSNARIHDRAPRCSYDDDIDCEPPPELEGGSALFVFDAASGTELLEESLSAFDMMDIGRYRLVDADADGIPNILIDSFTCESDDDTCDWIDTDPATWDATLRQLRRSSAGDDSLGIYTETRFCRFDAETHTYRSIHMY